MTDGFEVFVQLVIAAITTEPCSSVNVPCAVVTCLLDDSEAGTAPPSAHASTAAASLLSPSRPPTALRQVRREA
jgi:hypothetical protein